MPLGGDWDTDPLASPIEPVTSLPTLVPDDQWRLKALTRQQWDAIRKLQRETAALLSTRARPRGRTIGVLLADLVITALAEAERLGIDLASAIDARLGEIRG